jgi:hypothetical protein
LPPIDEAVEIERCGHDVILSKAGDATAAAQIWV